MKEYTSGKKNLKALRVDLVFTVESPKSVSCDAMTNGSCLRILDVKHIFPCSFGNKSMRLLTRVYCTALKLPN